MVKNAIQSVPENKIPDIEVELSEKDEHVYIKVKDNGSGIDDTISQKIFEPKFTTKNSGMGLGLAMVKSIVETYGGSISLISTKDKNTIFKVLIPALP